MKESCEGERAVLLKQREEQSSLWGERGMRKCNNVFEDERSNGGKSKEVGGGEIEC